jgi:tetratricopeptide (TPR) repeat protein
MYSRQEIKEMLRRKAAKEEIPLAVDPLETTPEMRKWAERVTAGATNELEKAIALFDAISPRVGNPVVIRQLESETAQEVFLTLATNGPPLNCRQSAFLLVALARAVGLKAYVTWVERAVDGGQSLHSCAAVQITNKVILLDGSYHWFGIPHQQFTLLDDLQTMGIHLCTFPDLTREQLAVKLAPGSALALYNLSWTLIELGRWSEVKASLPRLRSVDSPGALACEIEGMIAVHGGRLEHAIELFRRATDIDPHSYNHWLVLSITYARQGRTGEAKAALDKAFQCPHTLSKANEAVEALAQASRGQQTK